MAYCLRGSVAAILMGVCAGASTLQQSQDDGLHPAFTLPVRVDEVNLNFHVDDVNGRQIDDVVLSDLKLKDKGKRPLRVLDFERRSNLPLRAGILVDTSFSMQDQLKRDRQIVTAFGAKILKKTTDKSFVMSFDFEEKLLQDWTDDGDALQASLDDIHWETASRMGGTSIYDAVYRACRDDFGKMPGDRRGVSNVILLFTDGVDNSSRVHLKEAIDMCEVTHTAIYAFSEESKPGHDAGLKVLRELTEQSGGRLFFDKGDVQEMRNLRAIEQDARNDYLLVYKPAVLKPDGSFHRIELKCPGRNGVVSTRSGYYAPEP